MKKHNKKGSVSIINMQAATVGDVKRIVNQVVNRRINKSEEKMAFMFGRFAKEITQEFRSSMADLKASFIAESQETRDIINSKFDGVNRRIDDLALNRVKVESHTALEVRVKKLEDIHKKELGE